MALSSDTRQYVEAGKQFLARNDIAGFYEHLYKETGAVAKNMREIGEMFDSSGVVVEDYINELPPYMNYIPDRWIDAKNDIVHIPDNIKTLKENALYGCGIRKVDMRSIEKMEDFIFDNSIVCAIIVSNKLSDVSPKAFAGAYALHYVFYDDELDEDVAEWLKTKVKFVKPYSAEELGKIK